MIKMNNRYFSKLKLIVTVLIVIMIGFLMISLPAISQQKTKEEVRSQLNDIGAKILKDKNLTNALNRMNRDVILKAAKTLKQAYPTVYAGNGSQEEIKAVNQAFQTIFHEVDTSGLTDAILQIMPMCEEFQFSSPTFIQEESRLVQKYLGANLSEEDLAGFTANANEVDKHKPELIAKIGRAHGLVLESKMATPAEGGGGSHGGGSAAGNIVDLAEGDNDAMEIAGDILSILIFILILLL